MSADDPHLVNMVRQLARMHVTDRDFVLGQLGADEIGRLAPYMQLSAAPPLSEVMRSLGAACAEGRLPDGITSRAAAAIEEAIARSVPEAPLNAAPVAAARPTSFRSLISDFVAGR